ncbi:MAG: hypothetical protein HYW06_00505, partial [Gemmatimonadetes bacterium]|nr:hypothetical protein [Gemmatimonadota bacterium]
MAVTTEKGARRTQATRPPAARDAKQTDLAGPGIGDYKDLEKALPTDYRPLLNPRETQLAIFAVKAYMEEQLCREMSLMMVTGPL